MSVSPAYRLESLVKRRGGRTVLTVDRLEIPTGEIFCIVGPTGAGKSTMLRLLAGLEAADEGKVWRNGQPIAAMARHEATLLFQHPLLLRGAVWYNVGYGLSLRGDSDVVVRTEEVLQELGLLELATRSARALSGGEVQLVSLARALVLDTPILLLDEPTAHLDPGRVALVERALARRRGQVTLVWATHNLFQARRCADRVALLLDGRLVEEGPVAEIFDRPTDPRTADFLAGRMVY